MSVKDLLNAIPEDQFPAAEEGKCGARMQGREGLDRCIRVPGHTGTCVSAQTRARTKAKNTASSYDSKIVKLRELADELGWKLTASSPEAKAFVKAEKDAEDASDQKAEA
jgi:hypothetical protein